MHIAFVVPESTGGGIATFYRHFVRALVDMGVRVSVVMADPFRLGSFPDWGLNAQAMTSVTQAEFDDVYRNLDHLMGFNNLRRDLAVAWAAWRKLGDVDRVDIVEVTDWPGIFIPACVSQSLPYVVQGHASAGQLAQHDPQPGNDLEAGLLQMIELQLLVGAHRIQSYTDLNATFWERSLGRKVERLLPAFQLPDVPVDLRQPSGRGIVLGRLQRWKGPHILSQALRRLGSAAPPVDWYGASKPWGETGLAADRQLAADFPDVWGKSFMHHPPVPPDMAERLLSQARFSVVPSTWDVFNFVIVESMAAGRPTIASKGAGASELIAHGENGFLFESGDADGLAAAIETLLAMPEGRRREIGRNAHDTVRVRLDPQHIAKIRLAAYEEAIRGFRDRPPVKPHPWAAGLLTPRDGPRRNPTDLADSILEAFPQQMLTGHLVRRLVRRTRRIASA